MGSTTSGSHPPGAPVSQRSPRRPRMRPPRAGPRAGPLTSAQRNLAEMFPGYYDNYLRPRGYAVAELDSIGTGGSTGCPTSGDRSEQAGAKAAVDWLNGRARGWAPDGTPVKATW